MDSQTKSVRVEWDTRIPTRDGHVLSATAYIPKEHSAPTPVIVGLTPYLSDHLHDRGLYFAGHGFPFVGVDVRGRGNSEGEFRPYVSDAQDGGDVVEWVAKQSYCNGRVGLYGGSYLGYVQWMIGARCPSGLGTIAPTAAPFFGVDVPMRGNIFSPSMLRWLAIVAGRSCQQKLCADGKFWANYYRQLYESERPFRAADTFKGMPSSIFQEWLDHPEQDAYWDSLNPTSADYERMQFPILTITGAYDGDQPGALEHYKRHIRHANDAVRARHYLVIGPWNHGGCAIPSAELDGIKVGPESVIDMFRLHLDWYRWTLQGGARPAFLQDNVNYYVMGAECWRHAATLEAVTAREMPLYFSSSVNPTDVFSSGLLISDSPGTGGPDFYVYDPRDVSRAEFESSLDDAAMLTDQRMLLAMKGQVLVYHSPPFQQDCEVAGFFRCLAWLSIDQPDSDFRVSVYEVRLDGTVLLLSSDSLRARYRTSLRQADLIKSSEPLPYDFSRFTFVARLLSKGHRLRVVLDSKDSIYEQSTLR